MQMGMLHGSVLSSEISRWSSFLQWPVGIPIAIIILVSWILAWHRSSAADKMLATVIALFILILPFASVSRTSRYLVVVVPFFCALVVRLVWRVIEGGVIWRQRNKMRLAVGVGTAVVYMLACVTYIGLMFYFLRGADFANVVNRVASVVGPDSRIYGNPVFWVGHNQYRYGPYMIKYGDVRLKEAIDVVRKHDFDYAVKTSWLIAPPAGFQRPPNVMPPFRDDCLGDWVCRKFGTKVDEFYDPYYGPVE